jgi:membrane-associated protease RseP (regulator of RpoE activity)
MLRCEIMGLRGLSRFFAAALLFGMSGCSAVFPELSTPVRQVPPGYRFDPPPPPDLLYLAFAKASIPTHTRDGRDWDSVGGSLPDVVGKLLVDKVELVVTPVQGNTLQPTWPNQKRGNYRIPPKSQVTVELWDNNPINDRPICVERIRDLHEAASGEGRLEVSCESGAFVVLEVEPAHGTIGVGMSYELRTDEVFITKVSRESPAARAKLERGDQIVSVMGEPVKTMDEKRVRSLINANASTGLKLTVRAKGANATRDVELRDGPIYATLNE